MSNSKQVDALIVGAGFGGMYMLHRLRSAGLNVQVVEMGDGVGGTWYWNRYPGARVDIESMEYSYQFSEELQQEWEWSERYSPQPEILEYANHVADRFDLRSSILFETKVTSAKFDEVSHRWAIETDTGKRFDAQFCILATGCLSSTNLPDFEGLSSFQGDSYHTGLWPHEKVEFAGQRVGIIGTGSSAIQTIPQVAREAEHLTVFQRTANYSIPAHNAPLDPAFVEDIKTNYKAFRAINSLEIGGFGATTDRNEDSVLDANEEQREVAFEEKWNIGGFGFLSAFGDLVMTSEANNFAAEFVRNKIRQTVDDAETAELLCPNQVIGCKRICVDINYFETYNRDNVSLVNVKDAPIERITEKGLITGGKEYAFDCLIFATGFDAMTGTLNKIDIRGRGDQLLRDKWSEGPKNYLGLCTAGFPNMFTISGPGSPSVLTNMIVSIEQHVNWIADCIFDMKARGAEAIEAQEDAEQAWVQHVNDLADETLYPSCNSWYLGANIPGKTRIFMPYVGGLPLYTEKCNEVRENGYEGFSFAS